MAPTMAKRSGSRNLTAIAAILSVGAVLSFGIGSALAADEVTEDQILKALTKEYFTHNNVKMLDGSEPKF